ncbi:aromatic ring-hydroxylating dioxygenase subunit alpha [Emcibacter sp. SYSU 3D8]|uniref:aromatic ring-hydroxylating oxygenase subunit alpha n=1 Tax=Emcibacter sp. SYSU 3D8 TaxID=3133969 RepID=UPI0031FE7C65
MNERIRKFNKADAPAFESYQDIIARDSTPVADLLALKSNPPQPTDDIPLDQFTSQAFFDLEMERMWPRVWQFVCREEHVPEVGDYWVHDIGDWSIVVIRTEDGIRGYYNSCLHRGTKLKPSGTSGWTGELQCPFHGWTWTLDGTLNEVPCAWEFKHLDYAANRLPQVKVEVWNSFVFINMDENARPLLEYLEVLPEHFARRDLSNWYTFIHFRKELACNWKVVLEAFMEAYHTPVVHPELTTVVGDWNLQHDVFGDHVSRDLSAMGVTSPTAEKRTEQELLDNMFLGDPSTAKGGNRMMVPEGETARIVLAKTMRKNYADKYGMDLSDLSDAEIIDSLKYNLFPNVMVNAGVAAASITVFWPVANDPNRSVMESFRLRPFRPEDGRPDPAEPVTIREDESFAKVPGLDPFVAKVYDQDTSIMRWQQEGMRTSKKGKATLSSYQESRIRRVHETLLTYLDA